ncbi:hypothetical protein HUT19_39350 [Streptomyces sp. NA02950]|nr:hypothetical protein HUT19_39350 [Streptomyces sp. NA02950]
MITGPASTLSDVGLLRPAGAGTPVEAAVRDQVWLQAMVNAEADPAAAAYVHRGATGRNILGTGAMMVAARAPRIIRAHLARTAIAPARLATVQQNTVTAGRTLALHTVPTAFRLKTAGRRQLVPGPDVYTDRPAGAFAAEKGLARRVLPWHTPRTPIAGPAAALAFTAGALGRIAVDVPSLSRTKTGEVADGCGGPSAMPYPRGPVLATLVRSAALQVPATSSGLPRCPLSQDERPTGTWHAEWPPLRESLRWAGGAADAPTDRVVRS